MAYSGQYKVINKEKYAGDFTKIIYRSMWEKYVFKWCDTTADVKQWSSEEIIIPYYYDVDRKYHRYFPDFIVKTSKGKKFLIEIKPSRQCKPPKTPKKKTKAFMRESFEYIKNQAKWKAAQSYCEDNSAEFTVITEKDLGSY